MDYLILCVSMAFLAAILYFLCSFPKYTDEKIKLYWKEENLKDLKAIVSMSKVAEIFIWSFFFICCFISWCTWNNLQQNMVQKLSLLIFILSAIFLIVLAVRMSSIKNKAFKFSHLICENNIVDAHVEKKQKNLWFCRFSMYGEELLGYLDEKPSDDIIKVAVLKYNNRKKMYLLQEMR